MGEKKEYRGTVHDQLITLLGGRCSCHAGGCWHDGGCQVDDDRCLQLDHVNGGGTSELQRFGSISKMYTYYLSHPDVARSRLQVLCANCNWVKRHRNDETATANQKWRRNMLSRERTSLDDMLDRLNERKPTTVTEVSSEAEIAYTRRYRRLPGY